MCGALLAAGPARAQDEDDPKSSTITEFPARPKPKPPAPPPPVAPPPAPPPVAPAAPPGEAPPSDGAPPPVAPPAPPQTPGKPPNPPKPERTLTIPGIDAREPGSSSMQEVVVPKGKTFDQMKVPGAITDRRKGIGEKIVEIKCFGNTKTDCNTVEYIANVKVGMVLSPELLEQAKLNLEGVGLFKDINLFWEELAAEGGYGVRLILGAKDKLSWIIAPIAAYSSTEVGGGLAYAESNAFGKNKKFLVMGQYTTAEKMLFAAWLDPQILDSRFYYRVDLLVRRDSIREYAAGYTRSPRTSRLTDLDTFGGGALFGMNLTRRLHVDLRLKIYYDNVQPSVCYNTTNRDGSGTPDVVAEQGGVCRQPGSSGWDNTFTLNFGWDSRSKVYGVQKGLKIDLTYQYGPNWLGDRQSYHLLSGYGMYAWRFFKEHNLFLKLGADVYIDPPFKMEVETGGALMRGFIFRQYRGDTDVRATLEYVLPLFSIWGLATRLIGFYDTNLTWFRSIPAQDGPLSRFVVRDHAFRDFLPDTPSGVVRDSWHNGVGLGLRFFLKGVVLPLVGVDVGYGFESQSIQVYLALGSNLD